jgi:GNAT superfamily N-acetyltransferase
MALAARMGIEVRTVTPEEFPALVPALVELFIATVDEGAALGFIPPVVPATVLEYWRSIGPELRAGSRVLIGAFHDERIVGAGQLQLPWLPNARHRAEVQKLFVDRALRGCGVGASLVSALHACARQRGRSLMLLNARREVAERFYKPLGYSEVGVIPGYSLGSHGERVDTVSLYKAL